jgi:hypothetical protein
VFGEEGRTCTLDVHDDGAVFGRVHRLGLDLLLSDNRRGGVERVLAVEGSTLKKAATWRRG